MSSDYTEKGSAEFYSDPTRYNQQKAEQAKEARRAQVDTAVALLDSKLDRLEPIKSPMGCMDLLELIVKTCGGEGKLAFIEVSRTFIRALSRVPMSANLHPFLPDSENNPRFNTVVSKLLMRVKQVQGVRWVSHEQGAVLMVEYNLNVGGDNSDK